MWLPALIVLVFLPAVCLLLGMRRTRLPVWLMLLSLIAPLAAAAGCIWWMGHDGPNAFLGLVSAWSLAASALLLASAIPAQRSTRLARGVVLAGLGMPCLPGLIVLLFIVAFWGGIE